MTRQEAHEVKRILRKAGDFVGYYNANTGEVKCSICEWASGKYKERAKANIHKIALAMATHNRVHPYRIYQQTDENFNCIYMVLV